VSYNPYTRRKYGNKKTVLDGMEFDSKKEAQRYAELITLQRSGWISNLECQKRFELIPAQKDSTGKVIEHKCVYVADFCYEQNGETIVEDVKGMKTDVYIIKRKLMLYVHGIRVREI
jgi:hypothetical protein